MSRLTQIGPIHPERIVDPRTVPYSEPGFRGVLPHLQKPGCTYFVTFCLADVAGRRAVERKRVLDPEDISVVAAESDPEPTLGACLLRDQELASIVEAALVHFQGERYALSAWCVMPNHVHVIVTPFDGHPLPKILQSWKGYSSRAVNRRLGRRGFVWQKESFDHIVRNEESFERFVDYVERNPVAAGLVRQAADWQFSSARFRGDL